MVRPGPEPAIAPPSLLTRPWLLLPVLAVLLVPFFVPIPLELRRHPIISPLGDQLHVVLLAALTLVLYWRGRFRGRLWAAGAVSALVGGAIEFVQIPFGRQAHLGDFGLDLVGVGLVVGWVLWRGHGRRAGLWLALALLMAIPWQMRRVPFMADAAYRNRSIFPLIADIEGPRDAYIWGDNNARIDLVEVPDGVGGPSRVVLLRGGPPVDWPSAEMRRFPHDWSSYETLALDVRLVDDDADVQPFAVRLDDFQGRREHTWIADGFNATTEWQTFRIPLNDRRVTDGADLQDRIFDLRDVDRILVYLPRPERAVALEIDNLRLE